MNKLSTLLGLLLGLIIVLTSTYDFHSMHFIHAFFDLTSAFIVIGGVLAAVLINYPLNQLVCIGQGFRIAITRESRSEQLVVDQLLDLAIIAQRQGVLALEKQLVHVEHTFLYTAIEKMLISSDLETLRINLNNELVGMKQRHQRCQEIFYNMASYAPAFGMLGTVMGLIIMMSVQGNSTPADSFALNESNDVMQQLLSGMGTALVTTFYGVLLANFIFLPIAGKLDNLSKEQLHEAEIIVIGILSIFKRESPLRTKHEILTFVSHYLRDDINEQRR